MNIKTVHIYVANDGTEFATEEECAQYEVDHLPPFFMFDLNGLVALHPNDAAIVYIPAAGTNADGAKFVQLCEDVDSPHRGITEEDWGWFFWDPFQKEYNWIPTDITDPLVRAIAFVKNAYQK